MRKLKKKDLEKITVDRKIVEGLRDGRSLTSLIKSTGKGKGYNQGTSPSVLYTAPKGTFPITWSWEEVELRFAFDPSTQNKL